MTRDQILEAAAIIFRTKGFHAASMQDIADAVSLQKASLYHHVSSKQEILLEILDRALDVITQEVAVVVQKPLPADKRFQMAVEAYLTTIIAHRDLATVLLLEHRSLEPAYQARHLPRRDRFERLWRDLITEGRDSGVFQCDNPALASRAILGSLNWVITWYRPDGALQPLEIAQSYARFFTNALSGDGLGNGNGL